MNYSKCLKCGVYHFDDRPCPDEFIIYEDDYLGESGKIMRGDSCEDVAKKYAIYRNDEGELMNGNTIQIEVMHSRGGKKKKFELSGEIDVLYTVTEIKPPQQ
jgi:hypothetical protein